jgi:hypothetical protein
MYYYLEGTFDGCKVLHISRASNKEADISPTLGLNVCPYLQESFGKKLLKGQLKPTNYLAPRRSRNNPQWIRGLGQRKNNQKM